MRYGPTVRAWVADRPFEPVLEIDAPTRGRAHVIGVTVENGKVSLVDLVLAPVYPDGTLGVTRNVSLWALGPEHGSSDPAADRAAFEALARLAAAPGHHVRRRDSGADPVDAWRRVTRGEISPAAWADLLATFDEAVLLSPGGLARCLAVVRAGGPLRRTNASERRARLVGPGGRVELLRRGPRMAVASCEPVAPAAAG